MKKKMRKRKHRTNESHIQEIPEEDVTISKGDRELNFEPKIHIT
jgi:hypothetical protein